MNIEELSQQKPAKLGLLQFAVGFVYIALVATFMQFMSRAGVQVPEFVIALMMLTLLVLSASIMAIVFFGIPAYLALKGNWTKALKTVGFTLGFALGAVAVLAIVILGTMR